MFHTQHQFYFGLTEVQVLLLKLDHGNSSVLLLLEMLIPQVNWKRHILPKIDIMEF